jgi:GNAT superfamily N-acetyltransferase
MKEVIFNAVTEWEPESIINLYRSAGWWAEEYNPEEIPYLIKSSFRFVVGFFSEGKETIAMGRILSDTVSTAIIQDMCVLDTYRNLGIGERLLSYLVNLAREAGNYSIYLVAEPETSGFYEKSGFIPYKNKIFIRNIIREL